MKEGEEREKQENLIFFQIKSFFLVGISRAAVYLYM